MAASNNEARRPSNLYERLIAQAAPRAFKSSVFLGLAAMLASWYPLPAADAAFAVTYTLYLRLGNYVCFNSNELALARNLPIESLGRGRYVGTAAFRNYMLTFQIVTVLAPLGMILLAPVEDVITPAVSPLVLLLVQVANEYSTDEFHDVIRILVPIGFNAYRLHPLVSWVCAMAKGDGTRFAFGLVLAVANLLLWTYNLFVFLLLQTLPLYFDKHDTPKVDMAYTLIPIPKKTAQ